MSMAPASRTTASAMAWTAGCEPTSALMAQASPPACLPAAWQAATVRAAASSLDRWLTTTVAPSRAKAVAMAAPMPRPAPVTSTTLPCRPREDGCAISGPGQQAGVHHVGHLDLPLHHAQRAVGVGALLQGGQVEAAQRLAGLQRLRRRIADRKSTRLNSSHSQISYAVFCLKKKNTTTNDNMPRRRLKQTMHSS